MEISPQQQVKLDRLQKLEALEKMLAKGNAGLLEYFFNLDSFVEGLTPFIEERVDEKVGQIKVEDGKDYVLTDTDKQEIINAIKAQISEHQIALKAASLIEFPIDRIAQMASKFVKVPVPQVPSFLPEMDTAISKITKECIGYTDKALESLVKRMDDIKLPEINFEQELSKYPEAIRDSLETIQEEESKLKIEAIGYLRKELDELKKLARAKAIVVGSGGSSGGGRIVKSYDLSSFLNGVTKTFSLPAFYRIISVHSTSFPFAFRESVDWTSDASAMTITFTSEISASSTLASGQTITIIYSE